MKKATYIYALVDPRQPGARYIGKTTNPKKRLNGHWYNPAARVKPWVEGLIEKGVKPEMVIIDIVNDASRAKRIEYDLIRHEWFVRFDTDRSLLNTRN